MILAIGILIFWNAVLTILFVGHSLDNKDRYKWIINKIENVHDYQRLMYNTNMQLIRDLKVNERSEENDL